MRSLLRSVEGYCGMGGAMTIQRYEEGVSFDGYSHYMNRAEQGAWVRYEDHAEIVSDIEAKWDGALDGWKGANDIRNDLMDDIQIHKATEADLAMLVRRLCARITGIKQTSGDEEMVAKALDYLRRKGLQGSVLREEDKP
jgi:hypothetical protein